jgi:hypothetical protein
MGVSGQLRPLAMLPSRKIPQDSIVSVMSRQRAGHSWFKILTGARDFIVIEIIQISLDVHPATYSLGTRIFFAKGKNGEGVMLTTYHHMVVKL